MRIFPTYLGKMTSSRTIVHFGACLGYGEDPPTAVAGHRYLLTPEFLMQWPSKSWLPRVLLGLRRARWAPGCIEQAAITTMPLSALEAVLCGIGAKKNLHPAGCRPLRDAARCL